MASFRFLRFIKSATPVQMDKLICGASNDGEFCESRSFSIFDGPNGLMVKCRECDEQFGLSEVKSAPLSDD